MFPALALAVAVDFVSALPTAAQMNPDAQWQSLVAAAKTAANEIAAGKTGPEVLNPLNNAQRKLPPDQPRPIDCWGMMVDAYSQRSRNPSYGIKRAQEAANCYQEKALASTNARVRPPERQKDSTGMEVGPRVATDFRGHQVPTAAPSVEQERRPFSAEPRGSSLPPSPAGCRGKILEHTEGQLTNFTIHNNWDFSLEKTQRYQDVNICIDANIVQTRNLNETGTLISFWARDGGNLYFAEIDGDGSFGWGLVENKELFNTNKLKATAFNQGIKQWNRLELDLKGNRATLFINGTYEGYLTGEPPEGGGFVGVGGRTPHESDATFFFRDFTISQ